MYTLGSETTRRKVYHLYPHQVAAIKQIAKDNGQCSDSAALRFIIDEFVRSQEAQQSPAGGLVLRRVEEQEVE